MEVITATDPTLEAHVDMVVHGILLEVANQLEGGTYSEKPSLWIGRTYSEKSHLWMGGTWLQEAKPPIGEGQKIVD